MQIYVALGLTFAGATMLPVVKQGAERLARIEGAYIHYFMIHDKDSMESAKSFDSLVSAFFGIAIGWSWTAIAASECALGLSWTCPKEFTFWNLLKFGIITMLYILVAVLLYHIMMEA